MGVGGGGVTGAERHRHGEDGQQERDNTIKENEIVAEGSRGTPGGALAFSFGRKRVIGVCCNMYL